MPFPRDAREVSWYVFYGTFPTRGAAARGMVNKAHTATLRRIAKRYGGKIGTDDRADIVAGDILIEVETAATLSAGIARLMSQSCRRYVAVTNRESLDDAFRQTEGTGIGVMDPQGNIVRESNG